MAKSKKARKFGRKSKQTSKKPKVLAGVLALAVGSTLGKVFLSGNSRNS